MKLEHSLSPHDKHVIVWKPRIVQGKFVLECVGVDGRTWNILEINEAGQLYRNKYVGDTSGLSLEDGQIEVNINNH